jgi:hypothetical protein
MNPVVLKLTATTIEIIGIFCLATEAIKIRNLRRLRKRYLAGTVIGINPILRSFAGKSEESELPTIYLYLTILIGAILAYVLLSFRNISIYELWVLFGSFVPGPLVVDVAVAVPTALFFLFILCLVGSLVVQIVSLPIVFAIELLGLAERYKVKGLIGIIGFLFFLIGAILKLSLC